MAWLRLPRRASRPLAAAAVPAVAVAVAIAVVVAAAAGLAAVALAGRDAGPAPPTVVAVQVRGAVGAADAATGVVLGPGRVLTVAHVLLRPGRVVVRGPGGAARPASVLRTDPALDLAVLRVPGVDGPPPRAGDAGAHDAVLVLRSGTRPRAATVRRRVVARLADQAGRPRRPSLELAADVRGGDSGAPVVTRDGRVVGVVYARSTRRPGTAYAVRGPGLRRLLCESC